MDHADGEFTLVLFEDVASDPMLPRTKSVRCVIACGHGEAVFFRSASCLSCLLQLVQTTEFRPDSEPPCLDRWRLAQATERKA